MKASLGAASLSLLGLLSGTDAAKHKHHKLPRVSKQGCHPNCDSVAQGPGIHRPVLIPYPKAPARPLPISPPRDEQKRCVVAPAPAGRDDAPGILAAFAQCNDGGTVVLDSTYTIASPLDLTFLKHVDVVISGTVQLKDDVEYWTDNAFRYIYQNATAAWRFGGVDVNIYGGDEGAIDGKGQAWYEAFAKDPELVRPILFVLDGLRGGSVSGLKMLNSPFWFNFVVRSSDVLIQDITLEAKSTTQASAKNTDGWDTYQSDNIVIQNSIIHNGDDCVSFKPNSTNMLVQGLVCDGSHGISVGSLGQYVGEVDVVENVYVYNTSMSNAQSGARIKVWPGTFTKFQAALNGGGGSGYVKNVTYDTFHSQNNDWAIELTQCYGTKDLALCKAHPSNVYISDILFKDFTGTTSAKNDPQVGEFICSEPSRCTNVQAHNINIRPQSGKADEWICDNMDNKLLDVHCDTPGK